MKKKISKSDLLSRKALLWVHPQAVIRMMTSKRWVITEGNLPEDVQFDHIYWDPRRQVWAVVCISKYFKVLKMGEEIPELPPLTFRAYDAEKDGVVE